MRLAAAILAVTLAAGACAPASSELAASTTAADRNPCFQARLARAYTRVGPDTLMVEAGVRGTYRMELLDPCPDLEWADEVAFRGRGGGTFVCTPLDAEIVFPRLGRPETCLFRAMSRVGPAEAAAYTGHRRVFRPWRPDERRWPPAIRRPEFGSPEFWPPESRPPEPPPTTPP